MKKTEFLPVALLMGISAVGMIRPLVQLQSEIQFQAEIESVWPTHFMGEELQAIPLTPGEKTFYEDFPGDAAQFQAGADRLILRRVELATRKLHPARDCFKGMGFGVEENGLKFDAYERVWSSFIASKGTELYRVLEMVMDEEGNTWSDISAWYWAVLLKRSKGPWTSYVRIIQAET